MSGTDDQKSRNTKLPFFVTMMVIVAGTAFWYYLTVFAAAPISPSVSKEFAEGFERQCFLQLQDQKQCRKLIGENHRDCLYANVKRVAKGEGDDGGSLKSNRSGYMQCMREKTGLDKK